MKVCVVGAGLAGISAVKACLEENVKVVCYERSESYGGMWRMNPKSENLLIDDTILNTSKEFTAFSDFPMPENYPNYLHNSQYLHYIENYCQHFKIVEHLRFNHQVLQITKMENFQETGKWKVKVKNLTNSDISDIVYDKVMVCNGYLREPNVVKFPASESFKGEIKHCIEYKNSSNYQNQRVLICGCGNSAVDIAVDVSNSAKQVYLSSRSGLAAVSRVSKDGLPFDVCNVKRFSSMIANIFPESFMNNIINSLTDSLFKKEIYGTSINVMPYYFKIVINDMIAGKLLSGRIIFKGPVERLCDEGVYFKDEKLVTLVDTIIQGTGYTDKAEFLDDTIMNDDCGNNTLYKSVFPYHINPNSIAFIGYFRTRGPLAPLYEMQSRWVLQVFKEKSQLPSNAEMMTHCVSLANSVKKVTTEYAQNKLVFGWFNYMQDISRRINCAPNILRMVITDPVLAYNCMFGPLTPYQYRLSGPNSWSEARETILTVNDRILAAFNTGAHYQLKRWTSKSYTFKKILFVSILSVLVYYKRWIPENFLSKVGCAFSKL